MRLLPLLLVSVSLVLAGCTKEEDTPPDGTTTPGTNGTTSATTSPTGTTPTGGTNTTTPPTAIPPMDLCAVSKDFGPSGQPPSGAPPTVTTGPCGTVPAGYRNVVLNITWTVTGGSPVVLAENVEVAVLDAAGTVVVACAGPGPGPASGVTPCTQTAAIMPGDHTLRFTGNGGVSASGTVTIS